MQWGDQGGRAGGRHRRRAALRVSLHASLLKAKSVELFSFLSRGHANMPTSVREVSVTKGPGLRGILAQSQGKVLLFTIRRQIGRECDTDMRDRDVQWPGNRPKV
jgi:hypothetical protein